MKTIRASTILCVLSAAMVAAPASAATYLVNPEGTGDFPTIQAAIDAVGDGDIIELTDGSFSGEGNSRIDYHGKAITVRSQSGVPDACVILDDVGFDGPICSFVSGEGPTSVLDGIGILGGVASVGQVAGVHCNGSSPTISNCRIVGNESAFGTGGMYCENGSFPTLTDCVFSGNHSFNHDEAAGRATLWERGLAGGTPSVGGMACDGLSSPRLVQCTFTGNTVNGAFIAGTGALSCATATVIGCTFTNNSGITRGAVTSFAGTFIGCTFSDNTAKRYIVPRGGPQPGVGGGLSCGPAIVDNCTFVGNRASPGYGGGIFCSSNASPTLTNTIIAFSEEAAAIDCGDVAPTLICCDLFGNEGGDWIGLIADQYGVNGNISEDPLFCGLLLGDFTLHSDSPCAPFGPPNEECDLIGAWPVGCEATPVELAAFDAIVSGDGVSLRWTTGWERNLQGFRVLRASTPAMSDAVRVTGSMILGGQRTYAFVDRGLAAGEYWYWLEEVTRSGALHHYGPLNVALSPGRPAIVLAQSAPNPFRQSTAITFSVAAPASVSLGIYDAAGRLVRSLLDQEVVDVREHQLTWDGRGENGESVASGVYFYRLNVGDRELERKLHLLR